MRRILSTLLAWFAGSCWLSAQGPQPIGFADTLLFNDSLHLRSYGYDGPAPLFVQAWFPVDKPPTTLPLSYQQLRAPSLEPTLQRVYDELLLCMDSAFIEYDLRFPLDDDVPIDYAPFTEELVKDSLFALSTKAHRADLPLAGGRPVIVYHHGSQGLSDENVWMAEHFASHGFIFLSCNFHWPLEGKMYGTPIVWTPDRTSIHTMLHFARQLGKGNKVFYIGHSWGAQEGWCTLYKPGLADAFVSLETTMEWKSDTAEVREKWPQVLEALTAHSYPMPILMVADTEEEPPFPMFMGARGELRYLDPKDGFAHESYTSAYLLRSEREGRFAMPDADLIRGQRVIYEAMLSEMLAFFLEHAGIPGEAPTYPAGDPFHRAAQVNW